MTTTISPTLASSSSTSVGTLSSTGIGSGLDVGSIVSQLVAIDQAPLTLLQNQVTSYQTEISAYGTLQSTFAGLQTAAQNMSVSSSLQSLSASVSDGTSATAVVASGATPGTHSLEVQNLAQAQKLASGDFATTATQVGTGTLTFQLGAYDATGNTFTPNSSSSVKSVTITSANDTLAGIQAAVNAADIGVTASIVNDGKGSRLVFTSASSGLSNTMKVTVADSDGNNTDNSGLSQLAYDPTASAGSGQNLSQSVAAKDASALVDGITVTGSTNSLANAIQGVTLNLLQVSSAPTTLTVAANTSALEGAAQSFVSTFNSAVTTLQGLTAYDPTTQTASALTGDATALLIQSSLNNTLDKTIALGNGQTASLADIGIAFQSDGTLALNTNTFETAVASNPSLVANLFAATGSATDSSLSYVGATAATQPGTYAVNVTRLASQGTLAGTTAAGLNIAAGVNDTFNLTLDGQTAQVKLTPGTYASATALATAVQAAIVGTAAFSGDTGALQVTANSSGALQITSGSYGADSGVSVDASAGALNLFGASPASTAGTNAAGMINGLPAIGNGQILIGAAGNAAAGLEYQVLGGATGARGTVTYAQGYAYQLNQGLQSYLGSSGLLASATNGLNTTITSLESQETLINQKVTSDQNRYQAEFEALDQTMESLNSTSQYLQQELAALPLITSPNSATSGG